MPELPENEDQRRLMERECLNRTISAVDLGNDTSWITLPDAADRKRLVGHRFTQARRHGKNLFLGSASRPWLAVHLGMTGRLVVVDRGDELPRHTRLVLTFNGGRRLAFRDLRKLGKVRVIDDPDAFIAEQGLGPDALAIGKADFAARIGRGQGPIKAALMDQHKLAGLGNLWSDEMLFRTGILPTRPSEGCDEKELAALHKAMPAILLAVIACEAGNADLPQSWLVHHRTKDGRCPRCQVPLHATRVGGRTAYYCPQHQR